MEVPVQDELSNSPPHSRTVLQAVAAETSGKVHVIDQGVEPNNGVLVKGVVVVKAGPGAAHLRKKQLMSSCGRLQEASFYQRSQRNLQSLKGGNTICQMGPNLLLKKAVVDVQVTGVRLLGLRTKRLRNL